MAVNPDAWVPLGEVARPHGVRGELRIRLYNPDSDLLLGADEVLVRFKDGDEHEVSVDKARRADDFILLKLYSVDDRNRADELRGAVLCMKRSEFPDLEGGEFYYCDVEGSHVLIRDPEGKQEERIWGEVEGFRSYPSVEVIVVRTELGSVEVPILDQFIVEIDAESSRVVMQNVEAFEEAAVENAMRPASEDEDSDVEEKNDGREAGGEGDDGGEEAEDEATRIAAANLAAAIEESGERLRDDEDDPNPEKPS